MEAPLLTLILLLWKYFYWTPMMKYLNLCKVIVLMADLSLHMVLVLCVVKVSISS